MALQRVPGVEEPDAGEHGHEVEAPAPRQRVGWVDDRSCLAGALGRDLGDRDLGDEVPNLLLRRAKCERGAESGVERQVIWHPGPDGQGAREQVELALCEAGAEGVVEPAVPPPAQEIAIPEIWPATGGLPEGQSEGGQEGLLDGKRCETVLGQRVAGEQAARFQEDGVLRRNLLEALGGQHHPAVWRQGKVLQHGDVASDEGGEHATGEEQPARHPIDDVGGAQHDARVVGMDMDGRVVSLGEGRPTEGVDADERLLDPLPVGAEAGLGEGEDHGRFLAGPGWRAPRHGGSFGKGPGREVGGPSERSPVRQGITWPR